MREIIKNFIVIEGAGGSGTTTLVSTLEQMLNDLHEDIVTYPQMEPTDGAIGKMIRNMVTGVDDSIYKTPSILANLFAADRENHVIKIRKLLRSHDNDPEDKRFPIILCDRYYYSSLVYQYEYKEMVEYLNRDFPEPEIKILLTCDIDATMKRLKDRDGEVSDDMFDRREKIIAQTALYKKIMIDDPEHNTNVMHIDTTNYTPSMVANYAFNFIVTTLFYQNVFGDKNDRN